MRGVTVFETFSLRSSVSDFHRIWTNHGFSSHPHPERKKPFFSDFDKTGGWEGANTLRMPVCKAEAHRALELLEDYYRYQSNLWDSAKFDATRSTSTCQPTGRGRRAPAKGRHWEGHSHFQVSPLPGEKLNLQHSRPAANGLKKHWRNLTLSFIYVFGWEHHFFCGSYLSNCFAYLLVKRFFTRPCPDGWPAVSKKWQWS